MQKNEKKQSLKRTYKDCTKTGKKIQYIISKQYRVDGQNNIISYCTQLCLRVSYAWYT